MTPQFFKLADGNYQLVYAGQPAPEGATACTEDEFLAAANPTPSAHDLLVPQVQAALDASDRVVIRCAEHGVAVPADWLAARTAWRNIISGADMTSTTLPAAPSEYPPGT